MKHPRPLRLAVPTLLLAVLVASIIACSGPQPLSRAIRSEDQDAYSDLLNRGEDTPRLAYYAQCAEELGVSAVEAERRDLALPTRSNPFSARHDPSAVSRGAVIYEAHCASCHGVEADGHGSQLPAPMPELGFHSFGDRFAATVHGGAPKKWFRILNEGASSAPYNDRGDVVEMPAFAETLAREQIWLVITYLQSLDHDIPDTAQGE